MAGHANRIPRDHRAFSLSISNVSAPEALGLATGQLDSNNGQRYSEASLLWLKWRGAGKLDAGCWSTLVGWDSVPLISSRVFIFLILRAVRQKHGDTNIL